VILSRATGTPWIFRFFNPEHLISSMPGTEKVIYLTFDDGPVPEVTPEVLRILREFRARATFFMVGDNIRKHPEVFNALMDEGHAAGNHTYHHLNGWKTSPGAYADDVMRCGELAGTRLFRPPYGRFTPSQYMILKKKFRFVLWSVLTYDFRESVTPEECLDLSLRNTRPGSIVVFHDSPKAAERLYYALPRFLAHFSSLGYRFEPLS
jgi:peptidoglycan/xylan/chitin deacetylase (PgdA/CDA1 family)